MRRVRNNQERQFERLFQRRGTRKSTVNRNDC